VLVFRFWLEKLSHCFTENFKVEQGYINPDILELFFGDSPFKFHTKYFYLVHKEFGFSREYDFMYHHVVIHGYRGFYLIGRKMHGELLKEEERYFQMLDEDDEEFYKIVEYEMFAVDNPQEHKIMYLCFPIGSKKARILGIRCYDFLH